MTATEEKSHLTNTMSLHQSFTSKVFNLGRMFPCDKHLSGRICHKKFTKLCLKPSALSSFTAVESVKVLYAFPATNCQRLALLMLSLFNKGLQCSDITQASKKECCSPKLCSSFFLKNMVKTCEHSKHCQWSRSKTSKGCFWCPFFAKELWMGQVQFPNPPWKWAQSCPGSDPRKSKEDLIQSIQEKSQEMEFAIFAYVDTWAGLGGWGRDDDVSFTCTHVTCYGLDISCICTHVTCYASHGEGWVAGVGMMTFLSLAHMWHAMDLTFLPLAHRWHATQVMGRVGWVGWGWWRFYHLHTCDMLRAWRFLHLHTCDMLRKSRGGLGGWGGDDDVSITFTPVTCYALDVSCTCTHVTCYASHGEGWVGGVGMMTFLSLAHMWRFNNRNWWKQLGQLCQQHWQKENTRANDVFFFGASYFLI